MKLSVVIGSKNARASIRECLSALAAQSEGEDVEIIVADNSNDGSAEIVSGQFPQVKLLNCPGANFVPQLWEVGIKQSAGQVIALTSAHCVPGERWIKEVLKAHHIPHAGIGGAIEHNGSGGLVQWAIYFLRYSRYMLPFPPEQVSEIAADNASYKKKALDRCRAARQRGFWEPAVHAELRKGGDTLWRTPDIVVYYRKSFSLSAFLHQRFWHGRQFGSGRSAKISKLGRIVYILLSPLIPVALFSRIIREVLSKKRHIKEFLLSIPIMTLFLFSWTIGELTGYLRPLRDSP